jgi:hypothetical protein
MCPAKFDDLFSAGSDALLAGKQQSQTPPRDGGPRWGLSAVLRPDPVAAGRLEGIATAVRSIVGPAHWTTGSRISSHFTLRALEQHRVSVPAADPALSRYSEAVRAVAADVGPVRLRLTGLTLTSASVMVCAEPVDLNAERLAAGLEKQLGADGWFEADLSRDFWYCNVVHFAGAIELDRAAELVDWVAARRSLAVGEAVAQNVELVQWAYRYGQIAPTVLFRAPLTAAPNSTSHVSPEGA